jgi:acylphosphatase
MASYPIRRDYGRVTAVKRLEATVHGRVQGVGFRWFVVRRAGQLGLVGWVANEAEGTVRVVVEGQGAAVDALAEDLRSGPPGAVVDRVDAQTPPPTGEFSSFRIRASAHSGD